MPDLGPVVFSVAMKEGSSEKNHLDFSDDYVYLSWVIAVGDWEGADFCAPQLGFQFPIKSGQIFAVRTRTLAHCSSPITSGRRIVFTCFAERILLQQAENEIIH